jgi:hypothetical protein
MGIAALGRLQPGHLVLAWIGVRQRPHGSGLRPGRLGQFRARDQYDLEVKY